MHKVSGSSVRDAAPRVKSPQVLLDSLMSNVSEQNTDAPGVYLEDGDGTIAFVDDTDDDVYVARRCYQRSGLPNPLLFFDGGRKFLEFLQSVDAGESRMPALVLLDLNMPGMGGFEVLEKLRARPECARLPVVVMLTNSDRRADVQHARELGANGFQTKPSGVDEYVAFFRSLTRQVEAQ